MTTGRDASGHRSEEFSMSKDEHVRATYVHLAAWAEGPTIRIQERAHTGRLSPGPEFPASKIADLVYAVVAVLPGPGGDATEAE